MAKYQVTGEHILKWLGVIEADDVHDAQAQLVDALACGQAELVDWSYEIERISE